MATVESMEKRVGSAAVFDALYGIEFPAEKQDILRRAGSQTIEFEPGLRVPLGEIILLSEKNCFASMLEISHEIGTILSRGKGTPKVA